MDPWVRGAYSYYRVGQANTYGQLAGASEGRFLFAGEHTSINNIGFLDGAVETGERAARQLLARVGVSSEPDQVEAGQWAGANSPSAPPWGRRARAAPQAGSPPAWPEDRSRLRGRRAARRSVRTGRRSSATD